MTHYLKISLIFTLSLLSFCVLLNAKIFDHDERINENVEKFTPVYGFGEGIIDSAEIHHHATNKGSKPNNTHLALKLEKPALVQPKPWAVYAEEFIGYTNKDSSIQLYRLSVNPKTIKKSKQPIEEQPIGEPIPLVPGHYTREFKDNDGKTYTITIKIEEEWIPIAIKDSGWLSTEYRDARVFKAHLQVSPFQNYIRIPS